MVARRKPPNGTASKSKGPNVVEVLKLHMIASQRRDELLVEARELSSMGNHRAARNVLEHAERIDAHLRALQAAFALPLAPGGSRPN